jgi:hypothetical protein
LEPLPISKALIQAVDKVPVEDTLSRNNKGNLNTQAIDGSESLTEKARQS